MTEVSAKLGEEIIVKALHRCSICHEPDVQVHHIEGRDVDEPHDPENLIVLCPDCHSEAEQSGGHGRKYTAGELRLYRDNWFAYDQEFHKRAVRSAAFAAGESALSVPPQVPVSQRGYYLALDEAHGVLDMPRDGLDEASGRTILLSRESSRELFDRMRNGESSRAEDRKIVIENLEEAVKLRSINRILEAQGPLERAIRTLRQ